mmetsp:Transcript_17440/g.41898  ORF Transcript_17440/g.41898 Transcript_17440/m.41898 type:complete len:307 (-) Transcript_17440:583-1503(-)
MGGPVGFLAAAAGLITALWTNLGAFHLFSCLAFSSAGLSSLDQSEALLGMARPSESAPAMMGTKADGGILPGGQAIPGGVLPSMGAGLGTTLCCAMASSCAGKYAAGLLFGMSGRQLLGSSLGSGSLDRPIVPGAPGDAPVMASGAGWTNPPVVLRSTLYGSMAEMQLVARACRSTATGSYGVVYNLSWILLSSARVAPTTFGKSRLSIVGSPPSGSRSATAGAISGTLDTTTVRNLEMMLLSMVWLPTRAAAAEAGTAARGGDLSCCIARISPREARAPTWGGDLESCWLGSELPSMSTSMPLLK